VVALGGACQIPAQGLNLNRPYSGAFQPPEDESPATSPFLTDHSALFPLTTKFFRDTTIIDFERRQVMAVRYDSLGFVIWAHQYGELNEYIEERSAAAFYDSWLHSSPMNAGDSGLNKQHDLKLAWELPVQYPGWAQRVLGNDPPRLSISGSLKITMAYEDKQQQQSTAAQSQTTSPGFVFDEQNQFTVSGSVGRLININITSNSQGDVTANDPLKDFKIDYKETKPGELEDEVVQQVTAGYTSFDMPGTQLSGFSESNSGLFGVKIGSKFGPVTLTTIASTEEGENQKLSVNNNGASGSGMTTLNESQFKKYSYYFLDTAYIRYYNQKYAIHGGSGKNTVPPQLVVNPDSLEVWHSLANEAVATQILTANPGRVVDSISYTTEAGGTVTALFLLLQNNHDYTLYPNDGYIHFNDSILSPPIGDNDVIGVYLRTGSAGTSGPAAQQKGLKPPGKTVPTSLGVLKGPLDIADSVTGCPERFPLMWRNVYPLPTSINDISTFQMQVYHTTPDNDGDTDKTVTNNILIGDIMGLTKNGTAQINQTSIFSFATRELIIPPYDTIVNGNRVFDNIALKTPSGTDMRDSMIYHFGPTTTVMQTFVPTFTLLMSGSSKQTVFQLGIGVTEASVRVMADGRQLQANVDYSLNVDAGTLELTSPAAKAANKIEIDFQRDATFAAAQTLFLGARAEMALPFLSDKSLIGLSVLFQSTSIAQDIPRINQEPYSKLLFDLNTHLDFQPAWMTALVNKIPFITTTAPSTATVDFEIAHSIWNPNTDNQAYIDDFESSQQVYALGQAYKSWYQGSTPYSHDPDSTVKYPPAWDWYWFTPVEADGQHAVLRNSVWVPQPNQVFTGTDQYENVLRLHVKPAPNTASLAPLFTHAWAAIMYPVPLSQANLVNDQYFEIVLKSPGGTKGKGRLRIQMGLINEDLCIDGAAPNGWLNKEDTSAVWRINHDPNLDNGLDTIHNVQNKKYYIPNAAGTGFDSLLYGDSRLDEWVADPAKDGFQLYDENNPGTSRYACRLRGDGWATASEDIYNDGSFNAQLAEQYHEFVIELADTASPYIDTTAKLYKDSGWVCYKMPLHQHLYSTLYGAKAPYTLRNEVGGIGSDDWSNIRMVRLVWDSITASSPAPDAPYADLIMDDIQFVGNQWLAVKDSLDSNVTVASVGTATDSAYLASLSTTSLVHRQLDQSNVLEPESSLLLNFFNIGRGRAALAQKILSAQPLSVVAYDSLTLAVYGDGAGLPPGYPGTGPLYNGKLQFVFRFGSDSSTYYECRQKLMPGWNNYVCVNLKKLSDLKQAWFTNPNHNPDSAVDTIDATGTLRIVAPAGGRQPNFASISWMAVGVIRDSTDTTTGEQGQIWVDELKAVGIKSMSGWSSRVSVATQWADIFNISADMNYQGGDFTSMTDTKISLGNSTLSDDFHLSTSLDKFTPKSWGLTIPIGGTMTSSLTRPQVEPNTDIYLTNGQGQPDGFLDMASAMINRVSGRDIMNSAATAAEQYETFSNSESFFASYGKANTSTNPAVDFLLQRMTANFNYSITTSQARKGQVSLGSDSDYVDVDTTHSYSGAINYDLSPRNQPSWTKWKPLEWVKAAWLPPRFKDLEFDLLPNKIGINVANVSYTTQMQRQFEPTVQCSTYTKDLKLSQGVQIDYTPIKPIIDLSYSLSLSRDFPNDSAIGQSHGVLNFLDQALLKMNANPLWRDYYILENEQTRSQQFKATFNPQIFDWLTSTADYSANFSGQLTNFGSDSNQNFMNATVNSGVDFNSGLTLGPLLHSLSEIKDLTKAVGVVKSGFDLIGFNSINFTYSANGNVTNDNLWDSWLSSQDVSGMDFMSYQLGLGGRSFADIVSGTMNDRSMFGGMDYRRLHGDSSEYYQNDTRSVTQSYQFSTSLALPKPIDLQFSSISLKWNRQYSVRPDTTFYDTTWTYPDLSVSAQSHILNNIKLVTKYATGLNLSSSLSLKRTEESSSTLGGTTTSDSGTANGGTTTTSVLDMSPLVGIDGTLKKWPISFKYQHTMHRQSTEAGTNPQSVSRDGDNLDLSYEIQKSSGLASLKIFKWSIPVRGHTTMGLTFERDESTTEVSGSVTSDVSNLSVTPHLSYTFTDNITGTMQYNYLRAEQNGAITTSNTASLIAEIKF
jgi:hypothetical protein